MLRNAFVVFALAACSPVVDHKNMPDAPADAPDTEAPKVIMSIPGDKATQVAPMTNVTLFFDGALDPSSVSGMTLQVLGRPWVQDSTLTPNVGFDAPGFMRVPGTVAYDDTGFKVTFTPIRPFSSTYEYLVMMNGVKDKSGNALMGPSIRFRTYLNLLSRQASLTSTMTISQWYEYVADADGQVVEQKLHASYGGDMKWMTSDDPVSYSPGKYTWLPDHHLGLHLFQNTTNVPTGEYRNIYDASGSRIDLSYYNGSGNGTWGDADDVLLYWYRFEFNANGQLQSYYYLNNIGGDGVWKSPDDKADDYYYGYPINEYDAQFNLVKQTYTYYGTDFQPRTTDDVVYAWYEFKYDATGVLQRKIYHNAPGNNGTWGDSDDPISFYTEYTQEPTGERQKTFTAIGNDGTWFSPDDVCSYQYVLALTTKKQPIGLMYLNSGPDTMPCNGDDVTYGMDGRFDYDASGNKIDFKNLASPGGDGVWNTADDRWYNDRDYDTAH